MKGKSSRAISGEAQPSFREMNGCYQAVRANRASFAGERAGEVLIKPMEQIGASEAKYRQLLDDINDGCIVVNLEGKIVFANAKMAKILGYKLEELIGETARKFTPSEFIPSIGEIRKSLEQSRRVRERFEVTLFNMDGNRVSVEVSAKFIEYQGEPAVTAVVRDVTKRKEAEEALRESEKKYSSVVELSADGIVLVQGGEIIFTNRSFYELLGFEASEIIGIDILSLISGDMADAVSVMSWDERQVITRRVSDEMKGHITHQIYQIPLKTKSGETVWVEINSNPIEYGGKAAHLAFLRDITERKRAEEALRESEERFRSVAQTASEAIITIDNHSDIIFWNYAAETIFDYSADEAVGKQLNMMMPERFHEAHQQGLNRVVSTGESNILGKTIEVVGLRKDGSEFPMELSLATWKTREGIFFTSIVRDITERKRAEEEVLRHTKRVEALHAVAQTVSQTLDLEEMLDSAVEKVKEAMEADAATISVVDERAGEIILKAHRGLSVEYIATVGRLKLAPEEIEVVMAWQGPIVAEDEALNRPNLIELWAATQKEGVQSSFAVPLLVKRFFLGAVAVAYRHPREFTNEDVELLSSMANQIAVGIYNAQLLAEAQARVEELKAAQEYRVQTERQRALAEMAGGVAHDFNNVLSIVLGRAQLALEDTKEPKLKESLQIIERSAYDAANMVRRLQEFTGATVGEKLEALDLNQVVKSALKMVETRRAENQVNGVKIDIDADLGGVYIVEGNPAQLRRVLVNVIFNAMDALPQGGSIAVKTAREDSWALLSISDTGIGMTEEVKKRIFDPFFTTKGSRGSGLGLSASHGIISKHGGSIEVDSTIEKGSTFYIRLPIFNGNRRKARED